MKIMLGYLIVKNYKFLALRKERARDQKEVQLHEQIRISSCC